MPKTMPGDNTKRIEVASIALLAVMLTPQCTCITLVIIHISNYNFFPSQLTQVLSMLQNSYVKEYMLVISIAYSLFGEQFHVVVVH